MEYFEDNRKVMFDDLEESGRYSSEIITEIKLGNYRGLKNLLSIEDRKNKSFMEPLLYAVKNEKATYVIYEYYDESLQYDIALATEIVKVEPELIEGTPLSEQRDFILIAAEINPRVIQHMSQELKVDTAFTEELCKLQNSTITEYAASECKMPDAILQNAELSGDKVFMMQAILHDASSIEYLNDDLKNDYEFMKEAAKNKEVAAYVVEHTEQFDEQGLTATKDAVFETATDEAISGFEKESKKVKEEIANLKEEEQRDQLKQVLMKDKQLERHANFFKRIQNGELDPIRAAKLLDKICQNMDDAARTQLKQYLKLDEAILQKQQEEQEKKHIEPKDIEAVVEDSATMEGIKNETGTIRAAIEETKEEKEEKTGEEK